MPAFEHHLTAALDGDVRFDQLSRALYSTDASVYQIEPAGVVLPRSREDVVRTVTLAAAHGVSITARGGGTSQAGQCIGRGLVLDCSKYLNRVLEVNAAEQWARVEPGVVLEDLNGRLREAGLRFAPDLSSGSRATVGGMIANNSSGARSIVYGKTIDHVLELHVVLADGSVAHLRPLGGDALDAARRGTGIAAAAYRRIPALALAHAGEIAQRFPRVLRRVGGYNLDAFVTAGDTIDLTKIIVGSEGTLGIVVEATIRLVPLPQSRAVLAVEFTELLDALGATPAILETGPSAIEIMDGFILSHTREVPALDAIRRPLLTDGAGALLCIEFASDDGADLTTQVAAAERAIARLGVPHRATRAMDPAAQARVWSLRESALGLSMAMKGDAKSLSFVEDTAVAPERLRDYIARFLALIRRHGTSAGIYAHASVGCLHVRPVINLKTDAGVAQFAAIAHDVADLVIEFGGALSGEHGDGIVRGAFTERMFGPVLYDAFREVKRTFDPEGMFNPCKIIDTPPLTANLRYGPAYVTSDPVTFFDFSGHGGFGRAVEMCSGVGACRKKAEGTMCPSYRATLDEQHSTRGRANVLRLAMAGGLAGARLGDDEVHDVLDLCLECRACKTECPVGVDVARFKSEFLAGYYERHGTPLAARAFGNIQVAAKIGSALAPLVNRIAASRPARRAAESLLGIDARRALPVWSRRTFSRQAARVRLDRPRGASTTAVALFADTFTEYSEPDVGLAARDVLETAGIETTVVPHSCCARPLISQGLLRQARGQLAATVDRLYDYAHRGMPVVFIEPSCLSALREDAPALLRGEAQRRAGIVAQSAVLFEELLERECAAGRAVLSLTPGPRRIVLHGHCHQRAMGLTSAARALLGRVPGAHVVDLDAGCCGMAGSFGYSRSHYDVSRAVGELKLLPAARALTAGEVLVAAGTSCRAQVSHFTATRPLHPATLLQQLLTRP